jgi:hypothetical protein
VSGHEDPDGEHRQRGKLAAFASMWAGRLAPTRAEPRPGRVTDLEAGRCRSTHAIVELR